MLRLVTLGALIAIAAGALFVGLDGERARAGTEEPDSFVLADFKCYKAVGVGSEGGMVGRDVFVVDQFQGKEAYVGGPTSLCNYVEKEGGLVRSAGEPYEDADDYTCYEMDQEGFFFDFVEVENQFGSEDLFIRTADELCVRSYKSSEEFLPGEPDPVGVAGDEEDPSGILPHLKCYPAFQTDWEDFEPIEVELEDQFRETTALVLWPVSLCTVLLEWDFDEFSSPGSAGWDGEAAEKSAQALVCYRIWEPGLEVNFAVVENELSFDELVVLWAQTLCVPSTKLSNNIP